MSIETHRRSAQLALMQLDQLLQKPPAEAHADLYRVERTIARLRDGLILELRQMEDDAGGERPSHQAMLRQANVVISLVLGVEYAGGKVQWGLLQQAQVVLGEIVDGKL